MSALTRTSHTETSSGSSRVQHYLSLLRRVRRSLILVGVFGLLIGVALGFLQVYPEIPLPGLRMQVSPVIVALVGMLLMGLACGVVTNLVLHRTSIFIRLLVAVAGIVFGWLGSQLMQGILYGPGLNSPLTMADAILSVTQLSVGVVGALFAIRFRQGRRVTTAPATTARQTESRDEPSPHPLSRLRGITEATGTRLGSFIQSRRQAYQARSAMPSNRIKITVPRNNTRQRPRWRLLPRRHSVHLGKQVTNVCPYCLEEVQPNDPRGRVVCDICGTPHHGDCWSITGKCQVPHLQT